MSCFLYMFFFQRYGDHRDLHLLTHSCPTRRSSDLADRRRVLERLDATEADMVRAAVGAVDDGVGFTGELVLKALVHQTPDDGRAARSEEHTSELQSLMRISYAVFCLKKKMQNLTYPLTLLLDMTLFTGLNWQ